MRGIDDVRYISLFSGIEAASVAWEPLGFTPVYFSEVEPFCCALLAHYYPNVKNVGDITKTDWYEYEGKADIVVGGSPCQAFSVAGMRKSMDDDRGNLTLEYVRVIRAVKPKYVVWENVPGVLSTNDNAFGCFLAALVGADSPIVAPGKCGGRWTNCGYVVGPKYSAAWRILDAQYFGLAQRRRRVYIVGVRTGAGIHPGTILLEPESLSGHPSPRREAGEADPPNPAPGAGTSRTGNERNEAEMMGKEHLPVTARALNARACERLDASVETFVTHALRQGARRLLPVECERLMGVPDNYTLIHYRGKPACDWPRYRALGNSFAVPVVRWIGERIQKVELIREETTEVLDARD